MVGVAGKSNGCATCRRRKIKCDEAKPVCKRCERAKRQCDGYQRFPVFINRNQTGYRKREPLEEVKSYSQLQRVYSPEAEADRLISWFREAYIRSPPSQHALQTQSHWMSLVTARQSPHPALKAALLAMSFAKWSRMEHNPTLRQNGRKHYQQSLGLIQKALRTEDALSDDILATTCVMTLYELSDPSYQHSDSWLDHVTGLGNLLCLRGPGNFVSPESRAILEHMRHIFMVRCLAIRTSCVFGSPQWRQLPWYGVPKSVEQEVFDQGLRLTGLWKDCDLLLTDQHRLMKPHTLLSTCVDITETLEPLINQISSDAVRINAVGGVNTAILLLSMTALSIQLGAADSAHKMLSTSHIAGPGSHVAIFDTAFEMVVKAQNLGKARKDLARRILWSVEARMKAQTGGALGNLRMLWSLQLAQEQFTPTDPEAEQCKAILASMPQRTSPFDALRLPLGRHALSPVYRSF